jgi:two-component system, cell cycle response regulator
MTARVLVVDDILPNVKLLEAKLSSEYFDVVTARNGREALEAVARDKPDIVLLDAMMPEMDGFEACRRMKSNPLHAHIPVVMVTALNDVEDRVRGLDAGADDFLTKPVDDVALLARVRSLVRLKFVMDELRMRQLTGASLGAVEDVAPQLGENFDDARVLVIEDDKRSAAQLTAALNGHWKVTTQGDGEQALIQAKGGSFDLIVVSASLKTDGLRLCSHLRSIEETRQVPLLLVVDEGDRKRLVQGLEIGVSDYVMRPVDETELMARARANVRRLRYQNLLRQNQQRSMAMSVTDALTGLYNRHYMTTHLGTILSRPEGARSCALMVLDIDHFKSVNDKHGHAAGDEVLREFAQRIQRTMRGTDLACRVGGEEFVLVMPETDLNAAVAAAERLRQAMDGEPMKVAGLPEGLKVTCSIGVTPTRADDSIETAFKRADGALYEAKNGGRNRVCTAF